MDVTETKKTKERKNSRIRERPTKVRRCCPRRFLLAGRVLQIRGKGRSRRLVDRNTVANYARSMHRKPSFRNNFKHTRIHTRAHATCAGVSVPSWTSHANFLPVAPSRPPGTLSRPFAEFRILSDIRRLSFDQVPNRPLYIRMHRHARGDTHRAIL